MRTCFFFVVVATLRRCGYFTDSSDPLVLSPDLGNVCFSSAAGRWLFSLEQFAEMYLEEHPDVKMPPNALARRLWGDVWYDRSKRIFTKTLPPINEDTGEPPARSFVEFVLEPLYKLYSMIVGDDVDVLAKKMHKLGKFLHGLCKCHRFFFSPPNTVFSPSDYANAKKPANTTRSCATISTLACHLTFCVCIYRSCRYNADVEKVGASVGRQAPIQSVFGSFLR